MTVKCHKLYWSVTRASPRAPLIGEDLTAMFNPKPGVILLRIDWLIWSRFVCQQKFYLLFTNVYYITISLYILLYICIYYYTTVYITIPLYILLYHCIYYYTTGYITIPLYILLYHCIYYYITVYITISLYILLYHCIYYYTSVYITISLYILLYIILLLSSICIYTLYY